MTAPLVDTRLRATPLRVAGVGLAALAVGGTALSFAALLVLQHATSTYAFDGVRAVDVDAGTGDLQVVADGGSRTQVEARESWSFSRVRHSERVVDGVLQLRASCPDWYGQCGLSYVVHVPAGTAVRARSGAGDLEVSGVGDVDAQASSGDVRVRDTTGTLVVRASSGDVRVTGARAGRVSARTGSGDLDLTLAAAPDDLEASAGSGDLTVRLPDDGGGYRVSTRTGSGDERVGVRRDDTARRALDLRTGSGDLDVGLLRR